ncbi:MAG: hypothetical protein NTU43_01565 [Bacteroidetes bacterium]|nr:hypothetical protein [Bacteroidota bacterium]
MKNIFTSILFSITFLLALGQSQSLQIPSYVSLPKDSILRKQLLTSLSDFMGQIDKPNAENTRVSNLDLPETALLLDEMKGIEKSNKYKEDHFFKASLSNVFKLNDSLFTIQLSYMAQRNDTLMLRAMITLLAQRQHGEFYFKSPLKSNTILWKSMKVANTHIYYKSQLNTSKAKECFNMTLKYDKKLSAKIFQHTFYCCDNYQEVLRLIGVDYKSDYNGRTYGSLSTKENNQSIEVDGALTPSFKVFDSHDLWHSRLYKVLSNDIINRPVDEGTAYLYGGSWGLSWKVILKRFKQYAAENKNADWLVLYNESKNYDEKAKFPLNVDFVINALIIQNLEKEKGFPAVMELLSCGKKEKDNENYFKDLERICGISKTDFNKKVWDLIDSN